MENKFIEYFCILVFAFAFLALHISQRRGLAKIKDAKKISNVDRMVFRFDGTPEEFFIRLEQQAVVVWPKLRLMLPLFPWNKWRDLNGEPFVVRTRIRPPIFWLYISTGARRKPHRWIFKGTVVSSKDSTCISGAFTEGMFAMVFKRVNVVFSMFFLLIVIGMSCLMARSGDWSMVAIIAGSALGLSVYFLKFRGLDLHEIQFKQRILEFMTRVMKAERVS
jgi:hypothetical protein